MTRFVTLSLFFLTIATTAFTQSPANLLDTLLAALTRKNVEIVDLSHGYNDTIPAIKLPPNFAQSMPFKLHNISRFEKTGENGPFWYWNWFWMGEHTGTHVDAPNHWITGRNFAAVDKIALDQLIVPAAVINVKAEAAANNDYMVSVADLQKWEAANGRIPDNAMVIMNSGWSSRWPDERNFMNYDPAGMPHSPGFSPESAKFLVEQRRISGLAVDTVSTDALAIAGGTNPPYGVHVAVHGAGKYEIEMIANVDRLPPKGSLLIISPLKIEGGSGGPARILALVPSR